MLRTLQYIEVKNCSIIVFYRFHEGKGLT